MTTPGRITGYSPPGGPGVRVDGCVFAGYLPPLSFDPLLLKVVARSPLVTSPHVARSGGGGGGAEGDGGGGSAKGSAEGGAEASAEAPGARAAAFDAALRVLGTYTAPHPLLLLHYSIYSTALYVWEKG